MGTCNRMFALLVLASVLFRGQSFSSEHENRKSRRDVVDFRTQIKNAVTFNVSDPSVCPTFPCVANMSKDWCEGFCYQDQSDVAKVEGTLYDCFTNGLCGAGYPTMTLRNVNVSIATPNFKGNCYLYGQDVKMVLSLEAPFVYGMTSYSVTAFAGYTVYLTFNYTFEGLSVRCQPCADPSAHPLPPQNTSSTCNNNGAQNGGGGVGNGGQSGSGQSGGWPSGGLPCCGNDLLTIVICLVQKLVSYLGLSLNLLACNCNCPGSFLGKRDIALSEGALSERQAEGAGGFQSAVSVPLAMGMGLVMMFPTDRTSSSAVGNPYVTPSVSVGSQVPAQYKAEIEQGISNVFNDYNVYFPMIYNLGVVFFDITTNFVKTKCPACAQST